MTAGNRLTQNVTGSAPGGLVSQTFTYNGLTNQLSGAGHDANGNVTSMPGITSMTYDVMNRLATSNLRTYGYDPGNKRIYRLKSGGAMDIWFYGGGQRMARYTLSGSTLTFQENDTYFGGRKLQPLDRLGSNMSGGKRYCPYGEEMGNSVNDQDKFATYSRDSVSWLDYADQRYYASTVGGLRRPILMRRVGAE